MCDVGRIAVTDCFKLEVFLYVMSTTQEQKSYLAATHYYMLAISENALQKSRTFHFAAMTLICNASVTCIQVQSI